MLLIKNVKVVDGAGQPAYPADVLVNGDKIAAIGNFPNKKADEVIEGLGGYLTPGFIDINTSVDHTLNLFTDPDQKNFLLQGVTTIVGGHCGSSLAPLFYGSLESIRKWADITQINVNWHTFPEFLNALKKIKIGVNFGSLIGHSTIRRALIGENLRDLTEKELLVFEKTLGECLASGALGLSTGLGYAHSHNVPYQEIKNLVKTLVKYDALHSTHLRNEKDEVFNSVNDTINLYKETGAKTLISHFRPLIGYEQNFEQALDLISKTTTKMDFHFDLYPFAASIIPIYTLLPSWAQRGSLETMLQTISDAHQQSRIEKELPKFKNDELAVVHAPDNKYLIDKAINRKNLLEIMNLTRLKALISYRNINLPLAEETIFSDKALVASNSGGLGERATQTFTRFLQLSQEKNFPLEKAIQKITALPAKKINLKNRGLVKESLFADLVIILNNKIQYVIVNGKIAVAKGELKQAQAGQIITKF